MTSVSERVGVGSITDTSSGSTTQIRSTRYTSFFPRSVSSSMASPVPMSFSPRKNPSRCPAIPELPSVPGRAVSSIWPTARLSTKSSVPGKTGTSRSDLRDAQDRDRLRSGCVQRALPGDDAFGVPEAQVRCRGLLRRGRLENREALELVAGACHAFDVKRAPRHRANKAEHPRRALCDLGPPAACGLSSRFHSRCAPGIT